MQKSGMIWKMAVIFACKPSFHTKFRTLYNFLIQYHAPFSRQERYFQNLTLGGAVRKVLVQRISVLLYLDTLYHVHSFR